MNNPTWNTKLLSTLVMALVLAACKSTPMVDKPAAVEDKSPAAAQAATKPAEGTVTADTSPVKEVVIDGGGVGRHQQIVCTLCG